MSMQNIIFIYIIILNLLTFTLYGIDKQKARRHQWRIPERTLLLTAALGGSSGALFGMLYFHHKTKKWKFYLGVPFFFLLHLLIAAKIKGIL